MNRQIVNRRYRIERKIGEGGAGEVYLAFDIVLNRRVAIKMLNPRLAANRAFRLRFEREAQATARLSHPNIIAIFDVGEDQSQPFIVMEYIEGQTLKQIIEQEGPFHPDDVSALVDQVAAALDYAHGSGIVHRDIKPQNILVDRQGLAKVVDFGIAKALNENSLTSTGSGLGTVHYISPEQASGLMATPESDVYSLGVITFEMLTGQLPFDADTAIGVAMRHLNDPAPDPSGVNPEVPPEAADVVLRALEKNPARRFPSAGAFAAALSDWRTYRAAPRLAARSTAASLVDPTAHTTRLPSAERATAAPVAPPPPGRATSSPPRPAPRRGAKPWLAGVIAVGLIAGLIAYGLGAFDTDSGQAPTPTPRVIAAAPTATATRTQETIVTNAPEPGQVAVPRLIGLSESEARSDVEDLGLVFAVAGEETSDAAPENEVIAQDPPPDREVQEGATVSVTLSSGSDAIDLATIRLAGRPWEEVAADIEGLGLSVENAEEGSATVPEGEVVRLEPADVAFPGESVNLVVSIGDQVRIPVELQGEPLADVRGQLEELGLTIAAEIGVSADVIEGAGVSMDQMGIIDGDVVGIQDNGAVFGGWIPRGTAVTLIYFDPTVTAPTIAPSA